MARINTDLTAKVGRVTPCAPAAWLARVLSGARHDPSNWSKIEREVSSPSRDEETLGKWAKQLGLKPGSDDWHKFHDYAAVDAGRIPDHVMENEELLAKLPAFFRTLSGQKPSREDLEKLLDLISNAN
jgi:hypothetical protein